ncbi:membrane protein [Bryobacterales bacterium F-183]|nr:membrane protein [Bryobacterales bacterium F-183]
MQETLDYLARHGYWLVFGTVLLEQLGLPIPAVPVLIAAGALAGTGMLSFWPSLLFALAACLISDSIWFYLGRRGGLKVLQTLCKISLEPDSCVAISRDWFRRMGGSALLVAKFIPGFSTAAPPMAGVNGMSPLGFLAYDGAGSLIWAGSFMGLGWIFHNQLEGLLMGMEQMGSWVGILVVVAVALYLIVRWRQRNKLIHQFLMSRISVDELKRLLVTGEAAEAPAVVDLRNAFEVGRTGSKIPGAIWLTVPELRERHGEIPRDREVVLYCSCPNEKTSAEVALHLTRMGIHNIRLLDGGYDAWRKRGFDLENVA